MVRFGENVALSQSDPIWEQKRCTLELSQPGQQFPVARLCAQQGD